MVKFGKFGILRKQGPSKRRLPLRCFVFEFGVTRQGKSIKEALENLKEALELYLEPKTS